jgi:cell division protein FtsI/penicillin-binding protein 2
MNVELQRARHRQMIIFLLVCAGMIALLGRLYYWQILEGSRLSQLANDEHIQNQIVDAPRGLIYDAQGRLLAANVVRDDVYVEPILFSTNHEDNFQTALAEHIKALRQVLPQITEKRLQDAFRSSLQTVRVASYIEPAQSQRLRDLHLPYTFLEPRTWRIYPGGDLASQVLGYVQQDGKGVYGIESKYNTLLAGTPGKFSAETDLNGNPLTVGASSAQDAVPGADLSLTIDSYLQYQVQQGLADSVTKMKAQSGTAVVINARTGAVVAMAGYPTFDPNDYGKYADLKGCIGQQDVYLNPALYCDYEPGSIMKMVTMAAALDQHVVTPDSTIQDPGCKNLGQGIPTVCNWDFMGHGEETMTQILQNSSNVGSASVALELGENRFYPYLERFGFGQKTNLIDPETPGYYRTADSPDWTLSDLSRQAFGQSIRATPIQMAMAYQALANGGVLLQPSVLASINEDGKISKTQPKVERRVISAETAKTLTQMLVDTAVFNKVSLPGYSLAIKTGTGTTQGISEDQTEASMAGFLPASNPQYVILVKIDRPKASIYGSGAAGPLWKSIAQQLVLRYSISPDIAR